MNKVLKALCAVASGLVLSATPSLATIKTDWLQNPNNFLSLYRVTDYYNGILYIETQLIMKGKRIGSTYGWAIDCKRHRMVGNTITWIKRDGFWIEERTGKGAISDTARNFDLYCSYIK